MFPKNHVKLYVGAGTSPKIKYVSDETTGVVQEIVKDCNEQLPNYQMFMIKNQVKAGINLQEVKTNVISNLDTQSVANVIDSVEKKTKKVKDENR